MSLNQLLGNVLPQFPQVPASSDVEVLREIPIETLYLALKDADTDVTLWFFENALPEQVQGLIDIDSWQGSEFFLERFDPYFQMIALCAPHKIASYMNKLDPEIIVRGLRSYFDVIDYNPQEPPEVPESKLMITLDQKYALILKTESPETREMIYLWLNKFSAGGIDLLRRHLESCKWENDIDLEEFAYQLKKGRLEDMGFVDYHEAVAVYSSGSASNFKDQILEQPLSLGDKLGVETKVTGDEETGSLSPLTEAFLPELFKQSFFSQGILHNAFLKLNSAKLKEVLLLEMIRVTNMSLSADNLLHSDLETIAKASIRSRQYLDLGLSYLTGGNLEEAVKALEVYRLADVYRLGWLVIHDLTTAAKALKTKYSPQLFAPKDRELLNHLNSRHLDIPADLLKTEFTIEAEDLIKLESLLKLGSRLGQLAAIGHFFTETLQDSLQLKSQPLSADESAYSRLLTGLFRFVCTNDANVNANPITPSEWETLASQYDSVKMKALTKNIIDKVPATAKALFESRIQQLTTDLENYIQHNSTKYPSKKFFHSLTLT